MNLIVFSNKKIIKLENCHFCIIEKNGNPAAIFTEHQDIIEILTPEDKTFPSVSNQLYEFVKKVNVN